MGTKAFEQEFNECRELIEARLGAAFTGVEGGVLAEAMGYSLMAGGKRIRPVIVLQFCAAAGGQREKALPAACAVEMLHTYSLIHDDLPCMDDDSLRRGRPTSHIVYGECMATLAGDALQAEAFAALFASELPAAELMRMGRILAGAAGLGGICLGQALDMAGAGRGATLEEITRIHELKTASMLVAAARMGVIAGGGGAEMEAAAGRYASALGLAFQVRDDVLDATATTDELGKTAGSDGASGKTTFASLLGVEACEEIIRRKTREAISNLRGHFANTAFLEALASYLEERKY